MNQIQKFNCKKYKIHFAVNKKEFHNAIKKFNIFKFINNVNNNHKDIALAQSNQLENNYILLLLKDRIHNLN